MKYSDIMFDFDGVLFDTSKGIIRALKESLDFHNIQYDTEVINQYIGLSAKEMISHCIKNKTADIEQISKHFRDIYNEKYVLDCEFYPGIKELITELYDKKIKLHIVSLKPAIFIEKILDAKNFNHYFDQKIVPSMNIFVSKKYEMIKTMEQYINKSQSIMVGDLPNDIIAGKAINIDTVAVLYGYGKQDSLEKEKPTYLVNNVLELRKVLLYEN